MLEPGCDKKKSEDEGGGSVGEAGNRVITLGCRLNSYESAAIEDLSTQAGLSNTIVVNTCAVTAEAERQARQLIRKLKRENPTSRLVVTGCSAQIRPEMYATMTEVDHVIGNQEKMEQKTYDGFSVDESKNKVPSTSLEKVQVNDIFSVTETASHLVSGFEGKVRAFVQIQNGCNHRCTFCTIPYARGNSRSVEMRGITDQIQKLLDNGYQEVVLTGVDITDYGQDLPQKPTLGQMIETLFDKVPSLKRIRLSSLDPIEIDDTLWHLIETDDRILPHFHLSLQAGDDLILKRMKRRHLRSDIVDFAKRLYQYRPNAAIGADIIAGFPTETELHFQNTLRLIDECHIVFGHIFPFSRRPNTPASRMPQVESATIKKRAQILREACLVQYDAYIASWVGRSTYALIEGERVVDGVSFLMAKTDHFLPILLRGERGGRDLVQVDIDAFEEGKLLGSIR